MNTCAACKRPLEPDGPFKPKDVNGVRLCGRTACDVKLELERLDVQLEGPDDGGDR